MAGSRTPIQKIRRLLRVVEYLQSGQGYNARELSEVCGVTRRQMFRDLKSLQDSGIPINYDAAKQAYWLPQATYLPPTELTLTETLSLLLLCTNLGDAEHGIPTLQPARDAAVKLMSNLPAHLRTHVGELSEMIEIWADPGHELDESQGIMQVLHESLRKRLKVRISYDSIFDGEVISTLVSPYRVLFAKRAWYVIGRSSLHRAVRMFHVGRILGIETTGDRFQIPPRFSLSSHFGNAWRFIRERGCRQKVVVRFHPLVARNVADVVWHKTQKLHWNDDGTVDLKVTVDGIHEISWWILSYGNQAEVLSPEPLRELIATQARSMWEKYRPQEPESPTSKGIRDQNAPPPSRSRGRSKRPESNSTKGAQ
ncbi:MAG: WYL domain-containing protein [Planctomycetaceae bacterium]